MVNSSQEPIVTSYALAPAKTITAKGITYAYRELGPTGGIPVVFSSTSPQLWTIGTPASWTPSRSTAT